MASKTLAELLALPANRSCADCRVTLVDSSQVYASYTPEADNELNHPSQDLRTSLRNFHQQFAPPGYQPSFHSDADDDENDRKRQKRDPALCVRERGLGHGVFVCAMCGAAHKLLQPGVAQVHAVQDPMAWNAENVQQLVQTGNSHNWQTFEAYLPTNWKKIRPRANTGIAERLVFCRAKYEALAFCLPPASGPFAARAWTRILEKRPYWEKWFGSQTRSLYELDLHPRKTREYHSGVGSESPTGSSGLGAQLVTESQSVTSRVSVLPNRLVDFFCVVSAGNQLDPRFVHSRKGDMSAIKNVDEFLFQPKVTDCYPSPATYNDMEFPEHVGSFVYPEGCHANPHAQSPVFFTFVLTCADGNRLYGGALKLHDKTMDLDALQTVLKQSNCKGLMPSWIKQNNDLVSYLPKSLVVLSHYPFFDLWRKFLLQIYRIALVEAPLPIERFIANFVSELPLPPPGKIQVRFGFTSHDIWTIQRPPDNELPLADISFQPLFACLSVSSVMVVMGCLLQETRVALVSKYYALLTPVAEALLSFLFPFHWHGMYIPIMPYSMLDILDAPMPFLVGLHSRYLQATPPGRRPAGVVFVDLDQDVVHLGWSDENGPSHGPKIPRRTPALPERDATKLKNRLAASASAVYILPDSGKAGSITYGNCKPLPFGERDAYSLINSSEIPTRSIRRKEFFGNVDRAYGENEIHLSPEDFLSGQGLFHEKESRTNATEKAKGDRTTYLKRIWASPRQLTSSIDDSEASAHGSAPLAPIIGGSQILEVKEPKGFSVLEVRTAFFKFLVGIFKEYRSFVGEDDVFQPEEFVTSLNLLPRSQDYVKNVMATQMFERFIQERIENPNDPEVMFFDTSIDAKQNRFRKAPFRMIMNAGMKDTSFLDDKSKQITEKYTPPLPSHMGLPDDGRTYHYGSFPELDPQLFGKVRAPIVWPEHQSKHTIRDKLRTSADMVKKQQSIVAELLGSPQTSGSSITLRKTGPNTLERALYALSRRFAPPEPEKTPAETVAPAGSGSHSLKGGSSHGPKSLSMKSKAVFSISTSFSTDQEDELTVLESEEIVFNARRKVSILVAIFMSAQGYSRLHLDRKCRFPKIPLKAEPPSNVDETTQCTPDSGEEGLALHERYAISIQSVVRRHVAREALRRKTKAVIKLQAIVRSFRKRTEYEQIIRGILLAQALARTRLVSFAYQMLRVAISKAQARFRGYLARKRIRILLNGRLVLFRRQIFILWKRSHTSLAYRTKFWTVVKKVSFLRHNLAVSELERLWNELNLLEDTSITAGMVDSLVKLSAQMGIPNDAYAACLNLDKSLDVDREEDFSLVSSRGSISTASRSYSFASNSSDNFKSTVGTSFVLTSERTQIYERLSQSSSMGNEQVMRLFDKFNIKAKDKKRKRSLAEIVWRNLDQAEESCSLMYELFPELKFSDSLKYVEPSRKGIRRLHHFDFKPLELDTTLRAEKIFDDRVRRNVTSVASIALCKVPKILDRLGPQKKIFSDSRRDASTNSRGFQKWSHCRRFLMEKLVTNELLGAVKPHIRTNTLRMSTPPLPLETDPFDTDESVITLNALERSLMEDIAEVSEHDIGGNHSYEEEERRKIEEMNENLLTEGDEIVFKKEIENEYMEKVDEEDEQDSDMSPSDKDMEIYDEAPGVKGHENGNNPFENGDIVTDSGENEKDYGANPFEKAQENGANPLKNENGFADGEPCTNPFEEQPVRKITGGQPINPFE